MTAKRVLDVGQCGMDHSSLRHLLATNFGAEVEQAHDQESALARLKAQSFDLVLVNRLMDRDGSQGLELIREMQSDDDLSVVPVMLVSNYADAQQNAVNAGAEPGFGKAELSRPETIERLARILTSS